MKRPKTMLLPNRGVNFSKLSQRPPIIVENNAQDHQNALERPSSSSSASGVIPLSSNTVTPTAFRQLTIEEYLLANPNPSKTCVRDEHRFTPSQTLAYNERFDNCHELLFATLGHDLSGIDMFMRYEHGPIMKGRVLATMVVHVSPGAKQLWPLVKHKIREVFAGLGDLFEDGWELGRIDFVVTG